MLATAETRKTAAAMLVVALLALLVHWPSLSSEAVSLDDSQFVTNNYLVRHPSLDSLGVFFFEVLDPSTVGGYYTPLTMTSLMVDCMLGGSAEELAPFHRTNLLLHAFNGMLLVLFLTQLFRSSWASLLLGALFVAHPVMVEPVTWISERKTLLATAFALGAMCAYVRSVRDEGKGWSRLTVLLYACSLLSKPTTLALPLLLVLLDYWPLRRLSLQRVKSKWPLFTVALISATVTLISHSNSGGVSLAVGQSVLRACRALAFYAFKLLYPVGLTSYYEVPDPLSLNEPLVAAGLAGVVLAVLLCVYLWRKRQGAIPVAVAFFVLAIFPTLGFVHYSWVLLSDKYLYFPVIGLLLPLCAGLARVWESEATRKLRPVLVGLTVSLVAGQFLGARAYLEVWASSRSLYAHMAEHAPGAARAQDNYGKILAGEGEPEKAVSYYEKAIALDPQWSPAYANRACVRYTQGDLDGAVADFRKALELDPQSVDALANLGVALSDRGDLNGAREAFEAAIDLDPKHVDAHNNYGMLLVNTGDLASARREFEAALDASPDFANALVNLGVVLGREGRWQEARSRFQAGIRSGAEPLMVLGHLAQANMQLGKFAEARENFEVILEFQPDNALVLNNSVAVHLQLGDLEQAERNAQQALELEPEYLEARINLAVILQRRGKYQAAVEQCNQVLARDPGNRIAQRCRADALKRLSR